MLKKQNRYVFVLFFFLIPLTSFAQQNKQTVDEQYKKAREAAFDDGDYEQARKLAYRALDRSPNYHGIRIFIARLYAWEQNYIKARKELQYILDKDPDSERALHTMVDVESWSGNYDRALEWTEKALTYYPKDKEFMLAKASALGKTKRYDEAEILYKEIIEIHSSHKAREYLKNLQLKQMKYSATISYRQDQFQDIFEPWHFVEFQLGRQTNFGSVIGRIQYANRFETDGIQFNIDAYPSIAKGIYAYISGGYSESTIYPRYRFGLSLYKSLPAAFELEGGIRYLDFETTQTFIYTASLSKYWGNYLFTVRSYLVPSSAGSSQSLSLLTRRYFGNARSYLGISGGFGSASTDIQFAQDIQRLNSWSINMDGQYPISKRFAVGVNAGFDSEEFINFNRERFTFKAFVSYRF